MKYQIARFSILQTAKITAILYVIFGFILVPVGCLMLVIPTGADSASSAVTRITGIVYLFAPIIYGVVGFVFTIIGTWVYNLVAARLGGVEFELTPLSTPPAQPPMS